MAIFTYNITQNMMLGQLGWDIILSGDLKNGSWFAIRLVSTTGVAVNDIALDVLNLLWNIGLYFYGEITKINNNSDYAVLAYRTGNRLTY